MKPDPRPLMLSLLLAALLPATATAQSSPAPSRTPPPAPLRALEQAIETHSGALLLPGSTPGTVTVTPCTGCRPLGLFAGASTTWMLGERAVSYEELRRALRSNSRLPVVVFYRGKDLALTRLVSRAGAAELSR